MKNPPHTYIQKLKGYLDPAVTRKVRSVLFPLACPSFLGEDGPRVRVPSCLCVKGPRKVSEKSLGEVTNCREKQREMEGRCSFRSSERRTDVAEKRTI